MILLEKRPGWLYTQNPFEEASLPVPDGAADKAGSGEGDEGVTSGVV